MITMIKKWDYNMTWWDLNLHEIEVIWKSKSDDCKIIDQSADLYVYICTHTVTVWRILTWQEFHNNNKKRARRIKKENKKDYCFRQRKHEDTTRLNKKIVESERRRFRISKIAQRIYTI
jgi:hypothetical protein